jgi:hypothetical protein
MQAQYTQLHSAHGLRAPARGAQSPQFALRKYNTTQPHHMSHQIRTSITQIENCTRRQLGSQSYLVRPQPYIITRYDRSQ